jgi:hypothetical protein
MAAVISLLRSLTASLIEATEASVDLSLAGCVKYDSLTLTVFFALSMMLQRAHKLNEPLRVGFDGALPLALDTWAVGFFPTGKRQFCRSEARLIYFAIGPAKNFLPAVPPNDRSQQSQTGSGIFA